MYNSSSAISLKTAVTQLDVAKEKVTNDLNNFKNANSHLLKDPKMEALAQSVYSLINAIGVFEKSGAALINNVQIDIKNLLKKIDEGTTQTYDGFGYGIMKTIFTAEDIKKLCHTNLDLLLKKLNEVAPVANGNLGSLSRNGSPTKTFLSSYQNQSPSLETRPSTSIFTPVAAPATNLQQQTPPPLTVPVPSSMPVQPTSSVNPYPGMAGVFHYLKRERQDIPMSNGGAIRRGVSTYDSQTPNSLIKKVEFIHIMDFPEEIEMKLFCDQKDHQELKKFFTNNSLYLSSQKDYISVKSKNDFIKVLKLFIEYNKIRFAGVEEQNINDYIDPYKLKTNTIAKNPNDANYYSEMIES